MKRLQLIVLGLFLCLGSQKGYTQISSSSGKKIETTHHQGKNKLLDQLVLGGNLSLNGFSSQFIEFSVAPKIGYVITDNFYAGIGFSYFYSYRKNQIAINNIYGGFKYVSSKISILSPNIWLQYKILNSFLLHAEFQINSFKLPQLKTNGQRVDNEGWQILEYERFNAPSLLLGGGLYQPIYGRNSIFILFLYDAFHESNSKKGQSMYMNGIDIRFGFHIGL